MNTLSDDGVATVCSWCVLVKITRAWPGQWGRYVRPDWPLCECWLRRTCWSSLSARETHALDHPAVPLRKTTNTHTHTKAHSYELVGQLQPCEARLARHIVMSHTQSTYVLELIHPCIQLSANAEAYRLFLHSLPGIPYAPKLMRKSSHSQEWRHSLYLMDGPFCWQMCHLSAVLLINSSTRLSFCRLVCVLEASLFTCGGYQLP